MSEPAKNSDAQLQSSMRAETLERRTIVARDAATGELLRELLCATPEEVRDAVRRARTAQRDWGGRPVADRARALRPVLEKIVARRDELARLISRETGKPRFEALGSEVLPTLDSLDFYLRSAPRLLRDEPLAHRLWKLSRSTLRREPWGVVGLVTPWNYPFYLSASVALSALVAGNAVVHKPSEHAPLVGLELESILRESGLPPALYHCLPGYGDTGAALIEAGCQKISFTGSVSTGKKVAAACGERLLPYTLELGGKDAAVVLADAPLERTVRSLVWGSFTNAGQVCASIERIFVQDTIATAFTERFVQETSRLRNGPDRSFDSDVGPLVTREQWEITARHVEDAKAKGAIVLLGGRGRVGSGERGFFYEPTILAGVRDDSLVLRDETFGPVVSIVVVSGEEEAVRRVNELPYGLTASVWTGDERTGERISRRLDVGTVFVNDVLAPSGAGEASWGGVKHSGFGRTRGAEGLLEMTRSKHVARDRGLVAESPFWFPYSRERYEALSALVPTLFGLGSAYDRLTSVAQALRAFLKKSASESKRQES
jgi:succinate-semialdehyde dehydrogenase/glutarate-semialdehyde dehydrogenase